MKKWIKTKEVIMGLLLVMVIQSCVSPKEITYFQSKSDKLETQTPNQNYECKIQPGDILSIYVSSLNPEANNFFSFQLEKSTGHSPNYNVNNKGTIDIPLIGEVKVSGLTISSASDTIRGKLEKYLEAPSVMIKYENFRITVLGEVGKPGLYVFPNEKVSILEAIGMAGDLTINAKRKNVLLIREKDGVREFTRIDLTTTSIFNSPYYFLQSNDVIYVEPGYGKVGASDNFYRIMPIVMSTLTVLSVILIRF